MGDYQIFSTRSVYGSSAVTGILVLALWLITHNVLVMIAAVIAIPYLVTRLFHRDVNITPKVIIVIMIILAIFLSFMFLRYKDNGKSESLEDQPTTIVVDQQKGDEDTPDKTDDVEQQDSSNSNTGNGGGYRGGASFDPSQKLPETYSNVGGNSDGSGLSNGSVVNENSNGNTIQSSVNSQKELEDLIQQEVDAGKDKVDLEEGITGMVDDRPQEEKPNDAPQVDIDKENSQDITNEGEEATPPAQLPENDQLKQDAQEAESDKLEDLFEQTIPTVDDKEDENSVEQPEEDNKEDESPIEQPEEDNKEDESPIEQPGESNKENEVTKPNEGETIEGTTSAEPIKTPVTITAIDGNEAYAGDTVQFKVTGDIKTVDGLDGLDYSLTNGYLTVNTQAGVATVISPVITGVDGTSTATASVTVNVLNFN